LIKNIIHNHEKDNADKKLNRRKLSNSSKRKAQDVLHKRLSKIIHCELLAKSDIEIIDAQDLYRIRKNIQ